MEIGDRFGRLVYIEDLGMVKYGKFNNVRRMGLFLCDCGNKKEVACANVKRGNTNSCGCYYNELIGTFNLKHNLSGHLLYKVWKEMRYRCFNKNNNNYKNYGGRGIKVCEEWTSDFVKFYDWSIESGWKEGLQIDRINNNGNYEPSNCQFITQEDNLAVGKRRSLLNTSGFIGVSFDKVRSCWVCSIRNKGERITIKYSKDIYECVEARIAKEIELFGEQKTNFHYNKNNFKKD